MRSVTRTASSADIGKPTNGLQTMRRVLPYLWPDGQSWVKKRVMLALVALIIGKVISVSTPFFYKAAVDALAGAAPG